MKKSELRFIVNHLQDRVEALENEQVYTDAVVEALAQRVTTLVEALQRDVAQLECEKGNAQYAIAALQERIAKLEERAVPYTVPLPHFPDYHVTCEAECTPRARGRAPFPDGVTVTYTVT